VVVLLKLGWGPELESGTELEFGLKPEVALEPGWEAEVEHGVGPPFRVQRGQLWGILRQPGRFGLFQAGSLGPEAAAAAALWSMGSQESGSFSSVRDLVELG